MRSLVLLFALLALAGVGYLLLHPGGPTTPYEGAPIDEGPGSAPRARTDDVPRGDWGPRVAVLPPGRMPHEQQGEILAPHTPLSIPSVRDGQAPRGKELIAALSKVMRLRFREASDQTAMEKVELPEPWYGRRDLPVQEVIDYLGSQGFDHLPFGETFVWFLRPDHRPMPARPPGAGAPTPGPEPEPVRPPEPPGDR